MNLDTTVEIDCPYCGERIELLIDCSAGSQEYVEDCQVCCRPMEVRVRVKAQGIPAVEARREDD
jgi:hypothetical protein